MWTILHVTSRSARSFYVDTVIPFLRRQIRSDEKILELRLSDTAQRGAVATHACSENQLPKGQSCYQDN